jgi:VanZ family protein
LLTGYWLALFIGTHARIPNLDKLPTHSDKGLHFAAYAGLAFLLILSISSTRPIGPRHYAVTLAVTGVYGWLDELLQFFLRYRTYDTADLVADLCGIVIGLCLFWLAQSFLTRFWTVPDDAVDA